MENVVLFGAGGLLAGYFFDDCQQMICIPDKQKRVTLHRGME